MTRQQPQFAGMGGTSPSFTPVDTPDYAITAELLAPLKTGNKAEAAQAHYLLASVTIGFDGAELPRSNVGLPRPILSGMTPAERLGVYSGIALRKWGAHIPAGLEDLPTPECISELVKAAFLNTPWPLRMIAGQGNNGYNTRPGGLVRRMSQVLDQFPAAERAAAERGFRSAALSTTRPLHEDIQHTNALDLDSLIEGVTGRFAGKYQHEVRAVAQH